MELRDNCGAEKSRECRSDLRTEGKCEGLKRSFFVFPSLCLDIVPTVRGRLVGLGITVKWLCM